MSSNDNPRRDPDRPEDNPFIAFRRFADSQVSSLLNSVFTLPATLANFNNAHVAREQCLFGRADKSSCIKLLEIEEQIAQLRSQGRELYRVGDLQQVLQKGEELMQLDRQADELRKGIVEASRRTADGEQTDLHSAPKKSEREPRRCRMRNRAQDETALVEKVANEKGQQWGWSWDWGFPRPFDRDDRTIDDEANRRGRHWGWRRHRDEAAMHHAEEQWQKFAEKMDEIEKRIDDEWRGSKEGLSQWGKFFGVPPPFDAQRDASANAHHTQAQLQTIFDAVGNAIASEVPRIFESPSYSPAALEESPELRRAGVHWRDAFEDLIRAEHGAPLIPPELLGAYHNTSYERWARRFHDPSFARSEFAQWVAYAKLPHEESSETSEEPSYEYGHDHEDQHDEPPMPKVNQGRWIDDTPETELDAYELLLGRANAPGTQTKEEDRPSVLSTLTTTERTIAPDGTVTTKVVLKKRFTDGREESSETVHTQRGQETDDVRPEQPQKENGKKGGWFWSN